MTTFSLSRREWPKPRTTATNPHTQLDQQPDAAARGPREAFLIGTEFAHLHPAPDWSLHAALPPALAREAIDTGWVEVHPVARLGLIPPNVVMIYATRDDREVETVAALVRSAHAFARLPHGVHQTPS